MDRRRLAGMRPIEQAPALVGKPPRRAGQATPKRSRFGFAQASEGAGGPYWRHCRKRRRSFVLDSRSSTRRAHMRELILKMSMSVDGFVSDLGGTNTWMYGSDAESQAWTVETISNASLHIMGARSFLAMAPFWPTSDLPFAAPMNQIPKAVFSRQGPAILKNVKTPTGALPGGESWAQAYVASG